MHCTSGGLLSTTDSMRMLRSASAVRLRLADITSGPGNPTTHEKTVSSPACCQHCEDDDNKDMMQCRSAMKSRFETGSSAGIFLMALQWYQS